MFRNNYFPEHNLLLVHIIVFLFLWMAVQFHVFTSSFYPPNKGRWLPLAYGILLVFTIPNILGYIPREVIVEGDKLYPQYGIVAYLMAAALLVLLARNLYVFIPRLKTQDN
ncbi:MAG TPA: hypothetical protein VLH15_02070, partial [Dehalococcoidales bacterium]|nr:hypothetical protein [Dehalococcoidales bacterium]